MARRNWTHEETIIAFMLYLMLPGKEIDDTGKDIQRIAQALDRTPSAVSMKVWNIAANDVNRQQLGRRGLRNGSGMDRTIWDEFNQDKDSFIDNGLSLLTSAFDRLNTPTPADSTINYALVEFPEGKTTKHEVKTRVNQEYFRNCLLTNYEGKCCVTGLDIPQLLIASHIKPWEKSDPETERLNPANGLLLNAFHDKAFDRGFMTIDKDCRIVISHHVRKNDTTEQWLYRYQGEQITLPSILAPDPDFIEYHNDVVFLG